MAVNSFTHLEEITTSNTTTQTFFSHSVPENTSGADVRVRATRLSGTDILWYADMNGNKMTEN